MFQLNTTPFGPFSKYTLQSDNGQYAISFIPERGGCLISLILNGQEVLDGYQTPEEVDINAWGKSGVLYPFPNRLSNGQYTWQGQTYQFPCNDTTHQNALHGFGMERPLQLVEKHLESSSATITLEGKYTGEYAYYPWPLTFTISYTLSSLDGLSVNMSLRNDAETTIPAGLGWHPYFQLDETARACQLQLPSVDMVGVDARMIPTGKRYRHDEFSQLNTIGATILDNCFVLTSTHSKAIIKGSRGTLSYWQDNTKNQCNFLQVFTPPYGTSIALEPMTCNVDAFNNGEGLTHLAPGEKIKIEANISMI